MLIHFVVGAVPEAFGASRYKGSTAGIKALSCSMRVSPEGCVDKNSGGFLPLVAFIIFCHTDMAARGL
jgi:hypothetical protein